jgi:multidrug resistance efflux pump
MSSKAASSDANGAIELKVSSLQWASLWRLARTGLIVAGCSTGIALYMSGGSLLLNANGQVTKDRIRVAAPFEARIADVFVHPGDRVEAGQKIARVEASSIVRSLADLATERARLTSRVAQLKARQAVIDSIASIAATSAEEANALLAELKQAKQKGLAVWRSTQEISSAHALAADKAASLTAERASLGEELAANELALQETNQSFDELKRAYNGGLLVAAVDGVVGPAVSVPGQVLNGQNSVTDIYTGASFALAYLPDSYLLDVAEGQRVCVKAANRTIDGQIEKVLPVTEAVPAEFQIPSKVRERGQLAKIRIGDGDGFAIGQKISVTASVSGDCNLGVASLLKQALNLFKSSTAHASVRSRP